MKIAFIARNDGNDMRQEKICNSLVRLGHEVIFVGWNREPGVKRASLLDPRIRQHVFEWQTGFGELSLQGWPQFFRYISMVLGGFRPDAVHVRDEQIAALVLPLKGRVYRHLVLDIFDSLRARGTSDPRLKAAFWGMRQLAHLGSDRIIETSEELQAMLGRHRARSIVVMNVPPDPGDEVARDFPDAPAVQICTGGSLTREREGLETLLRAAEMLGEGAVEIQSSGWLHDDYAKEVFVKHPAVRYRWLERPADFRRMAARCDALTYLCNNLSGTDYRAKVLPNRFFDAMSLGRPLIVSNRLAIARWVEEQQLGYVCDPDDAAQLAEILRTLKEKRAELPAYTERVRQIYLKHYTWPIMEQRLGALYEGLGSGRTVSVPTRTTA
jgi:glycosyltransferase involved in cell wall biosynthesis